VVVPRTALPGHYTVWVGLFDASQRARASAPRARVVDNAIAASELEVAP
jgi:hypothetical protein